MGNVKILHRSFIQYAAFVSCVIGLLITVHSLSKHNLYCHNVRAALQTSTKFVSPHHPMYQRKEFGEMTAFEASNLVNTSLSRSKELVEAIRKRCQLLGMPNKRWSFDEFQKPRLLIYRKSIKVIYSSNPKTGSSSFKKFLYKLDGVLDPHGVHKPLNHYTGINALTLSKDEFYSNLIIGAVRNPAIRLISGFRDKVLRRNHIKKVINPSNKSLTELQLFERFLELGYYNRTQNNWFLSNPHFSPQWNNMLVCSFPYNLLIQYENGNMDIDAFQLITNTTHIQYTPSRKYNGADTQSSSDVAYEWLSKLDYKYLDIIYKVYALDYDILNYSKWGEIEFPYIKSD